MDDYEKIIGLISPKEKKKALDAPSGQGQITKLLLEKGLSVDCLDMVPESVYSFLPKHSKYLKHDLNTKLPLQKNIYDYVISREGIEHLSNPYFFIDELCRVTKVGGYLILTTPNIMTIESRIKFLITGHFQGFRELRDNQKGLRKLKFQGHISPIYYWQLNYFLSNQGFEIKKVTTNNIKKNHKLLKRIFIPILGGLSNFLSKLRNFPNEGVYSDDFLYGDCLILVAQKVRKKKTYHGEIF